MKDNRIDFNVQSQIDKMEIYQKENSLAKLLSDLTHCCGRHEVLKLVSGILDIRIVEFPMPFSEESKKIEELEKRLAEKDDLIRIIGKQEVIKILESKLDVKFIEINDFLNKTSVNCKTCNLITEAKESIKLYKKDYSKYNTKEKLSCSVVRMAYDSNLKQTTSQTTYRKTVLKYCPECGKKL